MPALVPAEPIAEPIPIPPIAPIAPINILPLQDLPEEPQPLPTINPIFDIHPIEPIITNYIPKLYKAPKISHYTHHKSLDKHINVCHRPVREFIPNSICPDFLPRFISHRSRTRNGHTRSWFTVTFNNYRIEYLYGGRTGYTKANAYMEAARCLRHLYIHQIQLLDVSMGMDIQLSDVFQFIGENYEDDDDQSHSTTTNDTHTQPIINIVNSNVTITNTPNRHIVYDDDDNLEFVFESPEGTYGAPPADGDDDCDDIGLDFGEIIEI